MKTERRNLPVTAFPFVSDLDVRLTDLDFARHVNNAAVAAFYEEFRVRFHLHYFGKDSVFDRKVGGGVVAHVAIQYLRETLYGVRIVGAVGVARLGNSSYTLGQALFQNDECVGEATCVIAQRDNGLASPLDENLRKQLTPLIVPFTPDQ